MRIFISLAEGVHPFMPPWGVLQSLRKDLLFWSRPISGWHNGADTPFRAHFRGYLWLVIVPVMWNRRYCFGKLPEGFKPLIPIPGTTHPSTGHIMCPKDSLWGGINELMPCYRPQYMLGKGCDPVVHAFLKIYQFGCKSSSVWQRVSKRDALSFGRISWIFVESHLNFQYFSNFNLLICGHNGDTLRTYWIYFLKRT